MFPSDFSFSFYSFLMLILVAETCIGPSRFATSVDLSMSVYQNSFFTLTAGFVLVVEVDHLVIVQG